MNEQLRWTLILASILIVIFLLSVNLFLSWNVYSRQVGIDQFASRIEKLEADVDMLEAIQLSNERRERDEKKLTQRSE